MVSLKTPERSLETAYHAARAIQALEERHFDGQPSIRFDRAQTATATVFEAELNKYLRTIRTRLAEFQVSTFCLDLLPIQTQSPLQDVSATAARENYANAAVPADPSLPQLGPAPSDTPAAPGAAAIY